MLPGARGMREQLDNFDEREITRTEAIIQSMTLQERTTARSCSTARAGCASPAVRAPR